LTRAKVAPKFNQQYAGGVAIVHCQGDQLTAVRTNEFQV